MKKDIAVISIITVNTDIVGDVNSILHDYRSCIIGRMGLPYDTGNNRIHIITIAIHALRDTITALASELQMLEGVTVKTAFADVGEE